MAPDNNWLSFSLQTSMDQMFSSSSAQSALLHDYPAADSHRYYSGFSDNFYANGWAEQKSDAMQAQVHANYQHQLTGYMDAAQVQQPPKLEDFFGGESTETQDSTLTHIYDHPQHPGAVASYYFNHGEHQQDLKTLTGFQAFSGNSGSEVDDSSFGTQIQSPAVESGNEFVGYNSQFPLTATTSTNALSLVSDKISSRSSSSSKAIIPGDSESCKKISDTFGQRTSIYRGVTRHRWTGRYEAHLWDNSCRREGQARKGRQVYLGGYDKEDKAARAYDLAALKYWGSTATTNFPVSNYTKEMEDMKNETKQEFIASLRRKSSGFSRGASIYRGVTRHHQQGRWQARIGRVAGNKDLYLGTFATEEEAAEAYDIAAIKFRGVNAVTNFEMSRYDVEAIARSSLPIGGAAKRLKLSLEAAEAKPPLGSNILQTSYSNSISFSSPASDLPCGVPYMESTIPFYHHNLLQHLGGANDTNNAVVVSDASAAASSLVNPMSLVAPAPQQEFFIWPHHQSY